MTPAPGASSSYTPKAASCESSRNGDPGSRSRRKRSRGSSFPRATCLARAGSSPPCAARSTLARRSATSSASARAFAWNSSERGFSLLLMTGISPAAGREPFVDLIQPVRAPEGLAVDDDVGRAERAAPDSLLYLGARAVFHRLIGDACADFIGLQAELRAHGDRVVGARNVHVVEEVSLVERLGEVLRPPGFSCVQPVESATRGNRGNGKNRGRAIGNAVILGRSDYVA